jgi:hypothetical protein
MKIKESRSILAKIDANLEGMEFISDNRNEFSLPLFDIAIDHAKSIIILCENGIFSSAYALARPMFECYVRASWLQHSATEDQISKIKKKDDFPLKLGQMIEAIETPDDMPKALSTIKSSLIKNLNSYTHGGVQLAARRYSGTDLVHKPDQDEVNSLLRMLSLLAFLSFVEIIAISKATGKDPEIEEIYTEIESRLLKDEL